LSDIAEYACEQTGDISSDALSYAKKAVRLKYATLYDAHNWREAMRTVEGLPLDSTLNGGFFLPYDAEEVVFCSLSYDQHFYTRLEYRERDWIERAAPTSASLPGLIPWFYRAENLAWPVIPAGPVTFTTANASPFAVYIAGRDNSDLPISERFILQGTPPASGSTYLPFSITTVNSYKLITDLSKEITSVPLTVQTAAQTLVLSPGITESVYTQIILYPPPAAPAWVRIQVKLKPDPLSDDMSVPRISHIWDALISFTVGALWDRLQQISKAQAKNADGMEHVKAAVNLEKNQAEFRQQVMPTIYDRGDYLYGQVAITSANPFGG